MTAPLWGLAFSLSMAVLLWLISLRRKDASIIDIFWGPGIAAMVDIAAWMAPASGERASAALFLVNLWAIRLAGHIFARHHGEDRRYAEMRRRHGAQWWWLSLVQVFLLQAILIWFIPAPLVAAMLASRAPIGLMDYAGLGIATLALVFEMVADHQLARFRASPANTGKVMDRGLWGWSRHPNYFGEAAMWWGFFLVGYSASHAWWLVLPPLVMTYLLLEVSGVSLMENGMADRRPGYAEYRRRVSAFVPMRPKR